MHSKAKYIHICSLYTYIYKLIIYICMYYTYIYMIIYIYTNVSFQEPFGPPQKRGTGTGSLSPCVLQHQAHVKTKRISRLRLLLVADIDCSMGCPIHSPTSLYIYIIYKYVYTYSISFSVASLQFYLLYK